MKFGQSIEYNVTNIFFQTQAENDKVKLVPDIFLFFKKALYEVEASGLQLCFNIFQ